MPVALRKGTKAWIVVVDQLLEGVSSKDENAVINA
jgi:hypothetical protein